MKENKLKNLNLLAILQGRLVNSERRNCIQYFPSKNWIKEFHLARNMKIKFIEWVANYENIKFNPILYKSGIKKIKKYKKKYNIKIRSIDMQFIINKPFFQSTGVEFYKRLNLLKRIVINTQKIGIKFVILPILENSSLKNITEENLFIKEVNRLSKFLNPRSYFLIESDYHPMKLLKFIEKINNRKVGINYDTGNSAYFGYRPTKEKIYFKYVKNVHLKDKKINGPSVSLGNGSVNFKNFFLMLRNINYNGYFSLQAARSKTEDHVNEVLKNYQFIKKHYNA
jgi:sugar phosphate isomerase/epimerase